MLAIPDKGFKLNVGAGKRRIPGFLSVDADKASSPDIIADVGSIPLPDGSANEIMAIHIIEHVHRWEAPLVLAEWFRLLCPQGFLVIECPDFMKCCRNVVNGSPHQHGKQGIWGDHSLKNPFHMHKWGWEVAELTAELAKAGFIRIKERDPLWHGHRTYRDMRLECYKP